MSLESLIDDKICSNGKKKLTVGELKEILKDVDDDLNVIILNNQYVIADDNADIELSLCASQITEVRLINYKSSPSAISLTCIPDPLNIASSVKLFDSKGENI